MKENGFRIFMVFCLGVFAILLLDCASGPAPKSLVCLRPGVETSYICERTAELGLTPEKLDSILLDASSIASIKFGKDKILKYILEIRRFVTGQPVSYVTVLIEAKNLAENSEDAELLSGIISRRAGDIMDSTRIVSEFDKALIIDHLDNQVAMLGGS